MNSRQGSYWLGPDAWKYGDVREITLKAIVNQDIVWSYQAGQMVCGGFTGPFEALAHALNYLQNPKGPMSQLSRGDNDAI